VTLSSCYRVACDAPGCAAAVTSLHQRTPLVRAEIVGLGWILIHHRLVRGGAPRIAYVCPEHHDWSPAGTGEDARDPLVVGRSLEANMRRLIIWAAHENGSGYRRIGTELGISKARAAEIGRAFEHWLARRTADAKDWREPWAQRLRAAGAIR
jgi:hypothetical protein